MPDQEKTEDCGAEFTAAESKAADLDGNPYPLAPQPLRVCHPDGTIQELPPPKPLLNTSITVVTEDVLSQRNWAWERIRYLEARIAELEATRPPAPVDPSPPPPAIFAAIRQGKP